MKTYGGWLRLSTQVGILPQQLMEQVSWRWYRTWLEWELDKWPKPGPIDRVSSDPVLYYLARTCQRIQQVLAKNPSGITLQNQYISFHSVTSPRETASRKESVEYTKMLFAGMVAGKTKIKYKVKKRKPDAK